MDAGSIISAAWLDLKSESAWALHDSIRLGATQKLAGAVDTQIAWDLHYALSDAHNEARETLERVFGGRDE